MNLLDLIVKYLGAAAAEPLTGLVTLLQALVTKYPDTAGELNPIIAALQQPIDPAALGSSILAEARDIASGKIDPREHPSDLAG